MASTEDLVRRSKTASWVSLLAIQRFIQLRAETAGIMKQIELGGVGPRKRRIPEDFKVSPDMMEWAAANKLPDPNGQLEAFKDYHRARGDAMLDWQAAFRTWLRNAKKWNKDVPVLEVHERKPTLPAGSRHDPKVHELLTGLIKKFDVRAK